MKFSLASLLCLSGLLALAPQAQAATLSGGGDYTILSALTDSNVSLDGVARNKDNLKNINLGAATLSTHNAAVVTGSFPHSHATPEGLNKKAPYLAVYGTAPFFGWGDKGVATFTVNGAYDTLSFNWGSVDSFNTLTVTDVEGKNYTITGSMVSAMVAGFKEGDNALFSFTALSNISKFVLSSTKNAFEAAQFNLSVSNVPLPAALPMFALALAGVAAVRARKKSAA